ncbi:MAG TPA: hypothetical protein VF260_07640 [Bacilli bacterium]
MQPIFPINEDTVKPYIGRNLYAITHEEIEAFGRLSRVEGGVLYFNEDPAPAAAATSQKSKRKTTTAKSLKAKRNHYGQFLQSAAGNFAAETGNAFALEMAQIAYLFSDDN